MLVRSGKLLVNYPWLSAIFTARTRKHSSANTTTTVIPVTELFDPQWRRTRRLPRQPTAPARSQTELRIQNTQIRALVLDRLDQWRACARTNTRNAAGDSNQERKRGKVTGAVLLLSAAEAAESRNAGSSRAASSGRANIAIR